MRHKIYSNLIADVHTVTLSLTKNKEALYFTIFFIKDPTIANILN